MTATLITQDAIAWARSYSGEPFHALFCDPPYHLTMITERFGKEGAAPAKYGKDGAFQRASKGFMGQEWDGGDVAFRPETWAAFGKVLYPGAFLMAFAGSRGYHRMACAIEDAGFVIHPAIGWLHASAMPKATRIDTQIQSRSEQRVVGIAKGVGKQNPEWNGTAKGRKENYYRPEYEAIEPTDDLAKAWVGHRYGLQALKPVLEFVCVAQKPYEGRPIDCISQTGAGALNIDAGRIASGEPYTINTWDDDAHPFGDGAGNSYTGRQEAGRWPANFVLDEELADRLDEQSDGVSEFYFNVQEQIDEADPIHYCAKASRAEREAGLDEVEPTRSDYRPNESEDGYNGNDLSARLHRSVKRVNPHPTVKTIALCKYLAGLLLPPSLYAPRRLFVPFAGVSSEMIGAHQAGWEEIVGVELEEEYASIGKARLAYWTSKPKQLEIELK